MRFFPFPFHHTPKEKSRAVTKNISDPHRHHPPSILRGHTAASVSFSTHYPIHTSHLRRPCSYTDLPELTLLPRPDTVHRRKPQVNIKRFRIAVSESPPADALFQMLLQRDARLEYNPAIPFCCVILINRNTGVSVCYIPYISLFCIPLVYTLYKICVSEIILREGRAKPGNGKAARGERRSKIRIRRRASPVQQHSGSGPAVRRHRFYNFSQVRIPFR